MLGTLRRSSTLGSRENRLRSFHNLLYVADFTEFAGQQDCYWKISRPKSWNRPTRMANETVEKRKVYQM